MNDLLTWFSMLIAFLFVGGIFLTAHMMGPPDSTDNQSLKTK